MKNSYLFAVLTLTCLLGLGISSSAQDLDKITGNIPFDFVAGGQTLPAGTYTVSRVSSVNPRSVVIQNADNSVFLLPAFFDGDPVLANGATADQAEFSFVHEGGKYFLRQVETPGGVYGFKTPRAMTQVAQMKDHGTASSSGAN